MRSSVDPRTGISRPGTGRKQHVVVPVKAPEKEVTLSPELSVDIPSQPVPLSGILVEEITPVEEKPALSLTKKSVKRSKNASSTP